jgi:hypothetical protein
MKRNIINFRAEFIIKDGKIMVRHMSRMVEANEPDTLSYHFYFNRNEQSVLYMKCTQILMLYLPRKLYSQSFSGSRG